MVEATEGGGSMAAPTKVPEVEPTPTRGSAPTVVLPDSAVIRTVPPERTPPGAATATRPLWIALIGLGTLLVLAVGVIAWQQGRVNDATSELNAVETDLQISEIEAERLRADLAAAETQLAQAETQVQSLEHRVERLEAQLVKAEQAKDEAKATEDQLRQTENQLARAQANEAEAKAAAQAARSELNAIAGTPLADGEWTGRLYMFGGTQVPPMVSFDERKLYRGQAAIDAMIADGIPRATAQACGADCVYWRNPSNGWRIMELSPYATVVLHSFGPDPTTMTLVDFTHAFNGDGPRNARISAAPYRLTMSGGLVTRVEEVRVGW
jgi:hypothetical protein